MNELAPYAVSEANSRGRQVAEAPPLARGEFQRDRDRIVHCTAFRRLEYKVGPEIFNSPPPAASLTARPRCR